jgi:ankyrin repeat protein
VLRCPFRLLKCGVAVAGPDGDPPLLLAADNARADVVTLLINAGAHVNALKARTGMSALMLACKAGDIRVVQALCAAGANVNAVATNAELSTPLFLAASLGFMHIVQLLLDHGANPNLVRLPCSCEPLPSGGSKACRDPAKCAIPSPLYRACQNRFTGVIDILCAAGADVQVGCGDESPLAFACRRGFVDVVRCLLACGADPNMLDISRTPPLHRAAAAGHLDVVSELVDWGVHVDACDDGAGGDSVPALFVAASFGHSAVVSRLIQIGANQHMVSSSKKSTLLHLAVASGNIATVEAVLRCSDCAVDAVDVTGESALSIAAISGHVAILSLLIAKGADPNVPFLLNGLPSSLLAHPAVLSCPDVLITLLRAKANPNWCCLQGVGIVSVVHVAAHVANLPALRLLADRLGNVNQIAADRSTPLLFAAQRGHVDVVKVLLQYGADPLLADVRGTAPLAAAAAMGHIDTVDALLTHVKAVRPDIMPMLLDGTPWPESRSALAFAAEFNHESIVHQLLAAGAKPNTRATDGITPLFVAAEGGFDGVVKALCSYGADLNLGRLHDGTTPLMAAAAAGRHNVVGTLLAHAANVHAARNTSGVTALWLAAANGHGPCVTVLAAAGAGVNIRRADGDQASAMYMAASRGHANAILALCNAGADPNLGRTVIEGGSLVHVSPLWAATAVGLPTPAYVNMLSCGADSTATVRGISVLELAKLKQYNHLLPHLTR